VGAPVWVGGRIRDHFRFDVPGRLESIRGPEALWCTADGPGSWMTSLVSARLEFGNHSKTCEVPRQTLAVGNMRVDHMRCTREGAAWTHEFCATAPAGSQKCPERVKVGQNELCSHVTLAIFGAEMSINLNAKAWRKLTELLILARVSSNHHLSQQPQTLPNPLHNGNLLTPAQTRKRLCVSPRQSTASSSHQLFFPGGRLETIEARKVSRISGKFFLTLPALNKTSSVAN
jgi:hypothetical protein